MPIIARDNKTNFTPCPVGTHQAVLADVIDKGMQPGFVSKPGEQPKMVHQAELRWQVAKVNPETGRPFMVIKTYTLSLNEKATLRKHLDAMRGKSLTEAELAGLDLEQELGRNCFLQVQHATSGAGRIYAKVTGVLGLPDGIPPLTAKDYTREVIRQATGQPAQPDLPEPGDDEVPF